MEECIIDIEYDEYSRCIERKVVSARKEYRCEECNEKIPPGTQYELYKGAQDDHIFTIRTCLDCVSIRESFFKQGIVQFGMVLEEVRENIRELDGEIDSKCLIPLTPKAKEKIFQYIKEVWTT